MSDAGLDFISFKDCYEPTVVDFHVVNILTSPVITCIGNDF